jgi:hypothetical protein
MIVQDEALLSLNLETMLLRRTRHVVPKVCHWPILMGAAARNLPVSEQFQQHPRRDGSPLMLTFTRTPS